MESQDHVVIETLSMDRDPWKLLKSWILGKNCANSTWMAIVNILSTIQQHTNRVS